MCSPSQRADIFHIYLCRCGAGKGSIAATSRKAGESTDSSGEQERVRWCFASVIDADDFAQMFGGTRTT
jgi:hypothetical protein